MTPSTLHILEERTADAAGNMAVDFLMFRRYPESGVVRYRHYNWRRPAFTFGYSQKIDYIRTQLPQDDVYDITRRSTGGGLVDHRDDWTYALVIPRGHPLFDRPGPRIYHNIHEALAGALNELGAQVRLQTRAPEKPAGRCFERPELDDVVNAETGRKVAGAALKRSKHGVLLQGSVWKPAAPGVSDWESLSSRVAGHLAEALQAATEEIGWPTFDPDEEAALIDQYASTEWVEAR